VEFDLNQTDELLATTRAVRKRLDFDRAVPRDVIEECIGLSQQAPTGTNSQGWRWLIIEDAEKRAGLAELYKKMADVYLVEEGRKAAECYSLPARAATGRYAPHGSCCNDGIYFSSGLEFSVSAEGPWSGFLPDLAASLS
jgi:nitroreductase